ncbi:response regulator [bacterium]|nr:response regulator [bacterium]MCP5462339.1 response regulator [bacterium]
MTDKPEILIVEDNNDNLETFSTFLEFFKYPVRTASDGEEALKSVAAKKPDVIFLDLSLPKIDGWEVARRIRSDSSNANIVIIAFSAMALPAEIERALQAGCNRFVSKPLPPETLIEEMNKLIQKRNG